MNSVSRASACLHRHVRGAMHVPVFGQQVGADQLFKGVYGTKYGGGRRAGGGSRNACFALSSRASSSISADSAPRALTASPIASTRLPSSGGGGGTSKPWDAANIADLT